MKTNAIRIFFLLSCLFAFSCDKQKGNTPFGTGSGARSADLICSKKYGTAYAVCLNVITNKYDPALWEYECWDSPKWYISPTKPAKCSNVNQDFHCPQKAAYAYISGKSVFEDNMFSPGYESYSCLSDAEINALNGNSPTSSSASSSPSQSSQSTRPINFNTVAVGGFNFTAPSELEYGFDSYNSQPISTCQTKGGNTKLNVSQVSSYSTTAIYDKWLISHGSADFVVGYPMESQIQQPPSSLWGGYLVGMRVAQEIEFICDPTSQSSVADGAIEQYNVQGASANYEPYEPVATGNIELFSEKFLQVNLLNYGLIPNDYSTPFSILAQAGILPSITPAPASTATHVTFDLDAGTFDVPEPSATENVVNIAFTPQIVATMSVTVPTMNSPDHLDGTEKVTALAKQFIMTWKCATQATAFHLSGIPNDGTNTRKTIDLSVFSVSTPATNWVVTLNTGNSLDHSWSGVNAVFSMDVSSCPLDLEGFSPLGSKFSIVWQPSAPAYTSYLPLHEALHAFASLADDPTNSSSVMYFADADSPILSSRKVIIESDWAKLRKAFHTP